VQAVKNIPVIGNGDIITPQAAKKMLDETGCAGVSIGRGAFYNPWIFKHTLEYLQISSISLAPQSGERDGARGTRKKLTSSPQPSPPFGEEREKNSNSDGALPPEPTFAERVRVMCRHLDLMIEVFGEEQGCRMFRKVAPWHAKRFGPCHEFNKRVVQVSTRRRIPRGSGKLHPLASAIPRRERRTTAALPPAAAGRVLHARISTRFNSTRTYSRA
jgi:tRNA-dihydrouridine synthase B